MNIEIGSFIELDLKNTGEYYNGKDDIARLNSARAGIYHACKVLRCSTICIPYYLCPTVKNFLAKNGVKVKPYFISNEFEPKDLKQINNQAVLIVNYFGIMSSEKIRILAKRFENVIVDNSGGFYTVPLEDCYNVYSPRKFFGVPDGCYVIGKDANNLTSEYAQDFSSDTSSFLLKRIEYGSSKIYSERMENEERIDRSGILLMSALTKALLNGIDYLHIVHKRKENFLIAHDLFKNINLFDPIQLYSDDCVPMVYPLVVEDMDLTGKLKRKNIYVGRLWNDVLKEVPDNSFEAMLSKYLVPIPIDQRYSSQELMYIRDCVINKKKISGSWFYSI